MMSDIQGAARRAANGIVELLKPGYGQRQKRVYSDTVTEMITAEFSLRCGKEFAQPFASQKPITCEMPKGHSGGHGTALQEPEGLRNRLTNCNDLKIYDYTYLIYLMDISNAMMQQVRQWAAKEKQKDG